MSAPLRFHFDFISPYAYLASTKVHALAARHGRTVELVPVLFAAMLDHWGHRGPAEIPPKRLYVFKQVMRLAHDLGVELVPPPAHPFNPLLALRVASLPMDEDVRRRLVDLLYAATWRGGGGVTDPARVAAFASEAGLDGARAVADAQADVAKARVRAQTERAIGEGVFGVPTIVADGEPFWGVDSLAHLEAFLRGEDPVPKDLLERWAHLPSSAERPRAR